MKNLFLGPTFEAPPNGIRLECRFKAQADGAGYMILACATWAKQARGGRKYSAHVAHSLDPTFEADPIGRRLECLPKKGININFYIILKKYF